VYDDQTLRGRHFPNGDASIFHFNGRIICDFQINNDAIVCLKESCSSNQKTLVYLQETVSESEVAQWLVQFEPILQNATLSKIGL
jgi:hypothetical protein